MFLSYIDVLLSLRSSLSKSNEKQGPQVRTKNIQVVSFTFFFKDFIYFLERGEGREKERERNINVWLPLVHLLLGTWPAAQVMCPDWEWNQQPFGLQASIQSTEPHQPGLI